MDATAGIVVLAAGAITAGAKEIFVAAPISAVMAVMTAGIGAAAGAIRDVPTVTAIRATKAVITRVVDTQVAAIQVAVAAVAGRVVVMAVDMVAKVVVRVEAVVVSMVAVVTDITMNVRPRTTKPKGARQ